jgi:hypothetical protein
MRIDLTRDPDLLAAEVRRLRAAIAALADQDATLSVCEGNVTVTMDATLTDAEREAVKWAVAAASDREHPAEDTLRALLERLGGTPASHSTLGEGTSQDGCTLTSEERLAIDAAAHAVACLYVGPECNKVTSTLRGLLERTK